MLGVRFRSGCIAAVAVLSLATPLVAQGIDIEAAWRRMFARPASPPPAPDDNPLAADRIALGARLFADTRLSGAGDRACATCHRPDKAFTDGRRRALGLSGAPLQRNTPAAVELGVGQAFLLGRTRLLARGAGRHADRGGAGDGRRLADDSAPAREGCRPCRSIPGGAHGGAAPYRRRLSSRRSPPTCAPWCRRRPGSMPGSPATSAALRPAEVRGFRLFTGKAGCVLCHVGWRFTDDRFHDIGLREPRRRPRRGAGRHAGADGVQDAEPARARAHGALHARRLAGDAGGGGCALRRGLRGAAVAVDELQSAICA